MPIPLNQQSRLAQLLVQYRVSPDEATNLAGVAEEYDRSYIWRMFYEKNKAEVEKTINELRSTYDRLHNS